ncbi:MAG: aldehyde dehydrogenase family protein [Zetaproteobacteria bacterium]|nr:aldehyde dehydrogenase family protein [Zetaproteobacteria bacterium]
MTDLDWGSLISGDHLFEIQHHWIGGKLTTLPSKTTPYISFNPNTGKKLAYFAFSEHALIQAIDCAEHIESTLRDEYSLMKGVECLNALCQAVQAHQGDLIKSLQVEIGKTHSEACDEVQAAVQYCEWTAKNAESILESLLFTKQIHSTSPFDLKLLPVGTAISYTSFSTPLAQMMHTVVASILARCPLIICSSTQACLTTHIFAQCLQKMDYPSGGINVVYAPFTGFLKSLADSRIRAIIYTGSAEHCAELKTNSKGYVGRQLILQSGGKNTALVHSSADTQSAAKGVFAGCIRYSGQLCTSTNRAFVFRSQLEPFIEMLQQEHNRLEIIRTDTDESTENRLIMGPLYSAKSVERFLRFQTMAGREAERSIQRGKLTALEGHPEGFFVLPGIHLMGELNASSAYQKTILMAPDLAIYVYDVLNEAIELINTAASTHVVSFYGDTNILEDRRYRILAPNVTINQPMHGQDISFPLAGRSPFGHHRFLGSMLTFYLSYPQALIHPHQTPHT